MPLTRAQKEYRSLKIADRIKARVAELRLSQAEVARRAGISTTVFRNAVLKYASREPDLRQLGQMSLALEWPVGYLPGLLDGTYDLSDDPHNLAEPEPPVKRKWKQPATVAPVAQLDAPRPTGLRGDIEDMQARIADLEATVTRLLDALGLQRKRA